MPTYKLVKAFDAGRDISKEWFVHYHYLKPEHLRRPNEPQYQRFKVCKTINSFHTVAERTRQLKIVHEAVRQLLSDGFNPFERFSYASNPGSSKYNIISCIDRYLEIVKPDLEENTFSVYEDRLRLFSLALTEADRSQADIDQISKQDIFDFVKKYQIIRGWSNKTYNHYLQAIHTFFQYFIDNFTNYVNENPCSKIKRLKVEKKGNVPFNNKTFNDALQWAKQNDFNLYQFCRFIYYSCLRPDAELRLLKIGHIDLQSRRIMVPSGNAKSRITQWVPIDDTFASIIREMELDRYDSDHYVFSKDGRPGPDPAYESYFRKRFRLAKNFITMPDGVTLYSFKHTRCIHLVEDGEKLTNIIKLTRHRTLAELMDYLKDMGIIIGDEVKLKSRNI